MDNCGVWVALESVKGLDHGKLVGPQIVLLDDGGQICNQKRSFLGNVTCAVRSDQVVHKVMDRTILVDVIYGGRRVKESG